MFLQAAESFATALESADRHQSPRTKCTVFASAASFCLDTGRMQQADDLLRVAEQWAARSAFKQDALDVFLVRADSHLANHEAELAWKLVEQSVLPVGERVVSTGEAGRHERLLRHYVAATKGWDAYVSFGESRESQLRRLPIAAQLEVRGLDAWLRMKRGNAAPAIDAIAEILRASVPGVLVHLAVVGVAPEPELADSEGIPNLKRVVRLFASAIPEVFQDRPWWPRLASVRQELS